MEQDIKQGAFYTPLGSHKVPDPNVPPNKYAQFLPGYIFLECPIRLTGIRYCTIMLMDEQTPDSNWKFNSDIETNTYDGQDVGQDIPRTAPTVELIEWSASEYISHEKSTSWYAVLGATGAVLTTVIFFVTKDVVASFATFFACLMLGIYAARKPATKQYILNDHGLQIDDKFFPYTQFRSFSIVEEGMIESVWLKPIKRFSMDVVLYFSPDEKQRIMDVLAEFLPHEQQKLDAIDRFSKRVRF